jgi:hypothetical protein
MTFHRVGIPVGSPYGPVPSDATRSPEVLDVLGARNALLAKGSFSVPNWPL